MATKEKKGRTAAEGGARAAASKKKGERAEGAWPHAGAGLPVPAPRLRDVLPEDGARAKLTKQFGLTNPHQIPALEKIVLNVGLGEAIKQPKMLDTVVEELAMITGQRPVRKKAKKSIANFGLREGQEIGAAVTLRGARMWEFLDRFIDGRGAAHPRLPRAGHALVRRSRELLARRQGADDLPGDQLRHGRAIHGMDITFVTTHEPRRPGVRAAAGAGHAVPRRRQADRRLTQTLHRRSVTCTTFTEERLRWLVRP